jgi:DNA-binding CsgD family transcriptional regulator
MLQPDLEKLLGVLYDADGGSGDFTPFLDELGRNMRAHVLAIQTFDARSGNICTESSIGLEQSWATTYADVAGENLWYIRGGPRLLSHGVCDDGQMDCAREMRRTRFHADFLRPTDIEHGMALRLSTEPNGEISVLTVNRSGRSGAFDDADRQLAHKLLPHLQNARSLHRRITSLEANQLAFQSTLDQLNEGIFHLASDGRILFANENAQSMMSSAQLLRRAGYRLIPVHASDCLAMYKALRGIASSPGAAVCHLRVHGRDGRLGGLLTLCPAPPTDSPWSMKRVAAIAFIRVLEHSPVDWGDHLKVAWDFTRAECRLAHFLLRGISLEDAATQAGVTKNTVRSQVRGMYEKTGTHRQGELVAALYRTL